MGFGAVAVGGGTGLGRELSAEGSRAGFGLLCVSEVGATDMQSAIQVMVPIPRRWAGGQWRSTLRPACTLDLRMILVFAVLGAGFWLGLALAVWALI